MTAHNPAMSFWPLERQLTDGTPVSDHDCREMLLEARRLATIERATDPETAAALARVRAGTMAAINAMGNLSHAMQIADAHHAERREAGE